MSAENETGAWECPRCSFVLCKRILSAADGAVGVDRRGDREVCPNDGVTMLPVTADRMREP